MAMVLYKECVQQSTSVLLPALVNCLCLLHLQRDWSQCLRYTWQPKRFSLLPTSTSVVLANWCSIAHSTRNSVLPLTWTKEFVQFIDPRQPHAVDASLVCAVVPRGTLWIWNLNSKCRRRHRTEKNSTCKPVEHVYQLTVHSALTSCCKY